MLASIGEESKYRSARNNYTFSPDKTQNIVLELKKSYFHHDPKLRDVIKYCVSDDVRAYIVMG